MKKNSGGGEKDGDCHRCAEVGEKEPVQLRRREDMTGLFLARHANNFLSARKAGQGGRGQINNTLKSLLQEIVVFFNEGVFMACCHHAA